MQKFAVHRQTDKVLYPLPMWVRITRNQLALMRFVKSDWSIAISLLTMDLQITICDAIIKDIF